jgi:hypothetical protein
MGAIVVRGNKDARLEQEEKNTLQANWLRSGVSETTHANKAPNWLGLLLAEGGAR